jgi:CRISPR/Cas system-associated endonuclease Cas1
MPAAIIFAGFGGCTRFALSRPSHRAYFLDWNGGLLSLMGPSPKQHAALVRRQVTADAVRIARALVAKKLEHCRAAGRMTATETTGLIKKLRLADTVRSVMKVEAMAAKTYWSRIAIALVAPKGCSLPVHWRSFAGRPSSLGPGPSRATRPINALLNCISRDSI